MSSGAKVCRYFMTGEIKKMIVYRLPGKAALILRKKYSSSRKPHAIRLMS